MQKIIDTINSIAQDTKKMVSMQYQKANLAWNQKQRQLRMQQQAEAASFGQIHMQEALGQVLSATQILPNLHQISYPTDLVPAGCSISADNTIYHYRWLKKSSERISTTALEIAREKINAAISVEQRKMNCIFSNLWDYEKTFFAQEHPAFYNGFHVIGLKDVGTDIIISAVFD